MAITRISQSSVKEGLEKYTSFYAGLSGSFLGDFESIATVTVSGTSTYYATFDNIPGGYQHLQVRGITRGNNTSDYQCYIAFNSDRGNNYARHQLEGTGASVFANAQASTDAANAGRQTTSDANSSMYGATIIDILDYESTTKNKTVRVLSGADTNNTLSGTKNGSIAVLSGLWMNTAAITRIDLFAGVPNWGDKTTFSLYGVRAP